MGTRREWLAVQFGVTANDKVDVGLIAALSTTLSGGAVKAFCESKNRFMRSMGKAIVALSKAELPTDLVEEKVSWEKAVASTKKELVAQRKAAKSDLAKKQKVLSDNGFSEGEVQAMMNGLHRAHNETEQEILDRLAQASTRITEIDLTPIATVNSDFLDTMAKVHTKSTGNGVRNVSGTVHIVHMAEGDFYVGVDDNKTWRVYDSDKKPLFDNTDCPAVTIASKTKARKVVYCWQYETAFGKAKSKETVNKVDYRLVNAGGVGADGELVEFYSEVANFK